jgi:hypothetical protein
VGQVGGHDVGHLLDELVALGGELLERLRRRDRAQRRDELVLDELRAAGVRAVTVTPPRSPDGSEREQT